MEQKICDERHKRTDEKLLIVDRRLGRHSERLDSIELVNSKLEERLSGLITQLGTLNTTLKWFIGLIIGSFVAFFFYAIQQNIF